MRGVSVSSSPKSGPYSAVVASVGRPRPKPAPKPVVPLVAAPVVQDSDSANLTPKAAAAIVASLGPGATIEQVLSALVPCATAQEVERVCTVLRFIMRVAGTPLPDAPLPPGPPRRKYKERSIADSMRLKKP